ncbi:DHS-like NAD/FAD-binding domain-containing protein [Armillaria gallica]|uniref:DHS-like NAD/FAD-binding domain-containing protein n=1 Tax=Armillaria gallica TaxID=47427 RepID=A0A2H3DSW8_ARMGA|nr:DHS-like NAD/FAD-binding domain-containing protein [Armillaria gallica]
MNDSKESLFVGNVVGALSAIPSCTVVPVSSSSFFASFPVHLHLHSLEPHCTRSSLPENTYFLLGGGGCNVRLDSRAGISTTQKFYYSAIYFICFVWRIQAGRTIISSHLLLYTYREVRSSSCNIIPYPACLPPSLHKDAVTIGPKLVSIPEMVCLDLPSEEFACYLLISCLVERRGPKKIIILSGAGLSVASGLSCLRVVLCGLMKTRLESGSSFIIDENSKYLHNTYVHLLHHFRVLNATPNAAHYVVARLTIPSICQSISPNSDFTHITQNIEGLCTRALQETMKDLQETDVPYPIEMHGRHFDVVCTAHSCDFREANSPIFPTLRGTELIIEAGGPEPVVRWSGLPRSPKCDQLCRSGVVWFGERPHRIHEIMQLADEADLCIIVGTCRCTFQCCMLKITLM